VLDLIEENEIISNYIELILSFEELQEVVGSITLPYRLLTSHVIPLSSGAFFYVEHGTS
jgi:hypothetical protein